MKHSKLLIAILVLPLIYSLTGCYPNKIDYVDEYDVAITPSATAVEDTDFSLYTTFSVIDTIIHVYDDDDDDDDPNLSRDNDEFILAQLRINMEEMGYTEIEDPDSVTNRPDLLLAVSATSAEYYYYYSYYPYYWGWYGWGWYGWGGYSTSYYYGYPWYGYPGWGYPYYGGYSSYTTGSLIVDMWDTDAEFQPIEERKGIVWTGIINGLLTGSSATTTVRIGEELDQLFIQSPYLKQ